MQIKIKYLQPNLTKIKEIEMGDWVDLRCAQYTEMNKGEHKIIPLGICLELPKGYEAHIVPRSSTFKNFGIIQTNHMGVVDESYKGDNDQWFFSAYALRETTIQFDDRICQFRIMPKQPELEFIEVESMNNNDRGGHGSTGIS